MELDGVEMGFVSYSICMVKYILLDIMMSRTVVTAMLNKTKKKERKRKEKYLIEALHQALLSDVADARRALAEPKHGLDHRQLGGGGVETGDCKPVIGDYAGTDDGRAAVDGAGDERHLEQ